MSETVPKRHPKVWAKNTPKYPKKGPGARGGGVQNYFLPYSLPRDCTKYHEEYRDQIAKSLVRNPGHPKKERNKETKKQRKKVFWECSSTEVEN